MKESSVKRTLRTAASKLMILLIAAAMVFTMIPAVEYTFAAEGDSTAAVLSVTGEDLVTPLSYESIKILKNDESIKPLIKENVIFHTMDSGGTEADITVTGVTIEDLINLAGLKDGKAVESVTVAAEDGYSKTYTADQVFKGDLQGNKAMFIWDENGEKVQKSAIGQFEAGEKNMGKWVKGNTITITVSTKANEGGDEPTPTPTTDPEPQQPTDPVFCVVGKDLKTELCYDSIKMLKNDESIKPLIKEKVVFHTVNSTGTEEDFTVTGVTIEDLLKLAGFKPGKGLESVTVYAEDGYNKKYTADQVLKADLQGNKAMFIWDENGEKVQKTAIGQFVEGENNKGKWVKGNNIKIEVASKTTVKAPGKVTIKSASSKKTSVTLKWKKVTGVKGYVIYRSTKKSSGYKAIKTITKGSIVKYTNSKLKKNKTYYYKIRAYKVSNGGKLYGSYSKVWKIKTKKR